ncbi:hypothetical protein LZZ85_25990 [Terrimonas sp. NA20]|uniref:Uncharacterized protein n=1 Tax=Terrimonas ginsenosidimutans TaxID=2908004 RepID=A0ABS9KZM8_9BACT|nr:hypothetical protein [Terrimonas ginsenosidimutans]MCG2617779.1 hypothetical protein [Terrimonas ginsenosidimutans]
MPVFLCEWIKINHSKIAEINAPMPSTRKSFLSVKFILWMIADSIYGS